MLNKVREFHASLCVYAWQREETTKEKQYSWMQFKNIVKLWLSMLYPGPLLNLQIYVYHQSMSFHPLHSKAELLLLSDVQLLYNSKEELCIEYKWMVFPGVAQGSILALDVGQKALLRAVVFQPGVILYLPYRYFNRPMFLNATCQIKSFDK